MPRPHSESEDGTPYIFKDVDGIMYAKPNTMNKRPPGRPPSPRGPRTEIVKVSLHPDELAAILRLTNAPAQFLREAAMEVAGYTYNPKPTRKARAI